MSAAPPLVSIGMPVFDGAEFLATAMESLLGQSYSEIEVIVSDNASRDRTPEICAFYAARDPRVHYRRNEVNIGPWPNFLRVLDDAHGRYFMWASDDDFRSSNYIIELVRSLEANPQAVLATPMIVYTTRSGQPYGATVPSAPGTGPIDNLRVLYSRGAPSWIYGLYRTGWLQTHGRELLQYPEWGGDSVWLAGVCLRKPVCGNPRAVLYKRRGTGRFPPSRWKKITLAPWAAWQLSCRSVVAGQSLREKVVALVISWYHVARRILPFSLYHVLSAQNQRMSTTIPSNRPLLLSETDIDTGAKE